MCIRCSQSQETGTGERLADLRRLDDDYPFHEHPRPRFTLTHEGDGTFTGVEHVFLRGEPLDIPFQAGFPLFLIREAWGQGANFEDLADGFGEGAGTHGDWSAIRDSSDEAQLRMLERALNYLFPREDC